MLLLLIIVIWLVWPKTKGERRAHAALTVFTLWGLFDAIFNMDQRRKY